MTGCGGQGLRDVAIVDSVVTAVPGNFLISNSTVQVRASYLAKACTLQNIIVAAFWLSEVPAQRKRLQIFLAHLFPLTSRYSCVLRAADMNFS